MRIAIIGRIEMLYKFVDLLTKAKHEVCLILTEWYGIPCYQLRF